MGSTSQKNRAVTRHVWRHDASGNSLLLESSELVTSIGVVRNTLTLDEFPAQFLGRERDLIDIATAVYGTDRLAPRPLGQTGKDARHLDWRRELHVTVPVRELSYWRRGDVLSSVQQALSELTDDSWHLDFVQAAPSKKRSTQMRLPTRNESGEVALFSGGLDSLAGTLLRREGSGAWPWLVSIGSNSIATNQQQSLVAKMIRSFREVPQLTGLRINNTGPEPRDQAMRQRARSFMYFVIAAVLARRTRSDKVLVLENGITSLNLPINPFLTSTRATRTTHPLVLYAVEDMIRLVFEWPEFTLAAPFFNVTKAEMVRSVAHHSGLIGATVSCAHLRMKGRWCGTCTACLLRRQVLRASGLAEIDRAETRDRYKVDMFDAFVLGKEKIAPEKTWYFLATVEHVARMLLDGNSVSTDPSAIRVATARARRNKTDANNEMEDIVAAHRRYAKEWLDVLETAQLEYPSLQPIVKALSNLQGGAA